MEKDLLPAGSVVLLKDSTKKLMIIGFFQIRPDRKEKVYDYCGCLYPEGYQDGDHLYLFDQDMIGKVYSVGYMDEEQFQYRQEQRKIAEKLRDKTE